MSNRNAATQAAPFKVVGMEAVMASLIQPKQLRLHTGLEGFDSPEAYGIYRHTGGPALGVVGAVYAKAGPPDLNLYLQQIRHSVDKCADWINMDEIEYAELKGGSKVRISVPGPRIELKTPMVGDILQVRLDFVTGFDGLTKTRLGMFVNRLWCKNGAARWEQGYNLAFKNTPGNVGKVNVFCDEIITVLAQSRDYAAFLEAAVKIELTQAKVDKFFKELLGFTQAEYNEQSGKKRAIFDRINQAVAIEEANTGANAYALLQGVTRYTTHDMAGGNLDGVLLDTAAKMTDTAHKLVGAMVAAN